MIARLTESKRSQAGLGAVVLLSLLVCLVAAAGPFRGPTSDSAAGSFAETRTYRVRPGDSQSWAAALSRQFAGLPNVSVLPDTRTHEIIVLAPPAVHDRIAAQLAPPRASATEPMPAHHSPPMPVQARQTSPPSPPTPSQASPAPVRQNVNLWNVSAAEFEANLLRAADGQLQSRSAADGAREYLLPVAGGDSPRLRVEPDANRVSIEGNEAPVRGAAQLVHALDSPRSEKGVGLVQTSGTRENELRRLLHAVQLDAAPGAPRRPAWPAGAGELLAAADQQNPNQPAPSTPPSAPPGPPSPSKTTGPSITLPPAPGEGTDGGRLVGPVQVETIEGWNAIIVKGRPEDVKRIKDLVQQLVEYSKITEPAVEVVMLRQADASTLGTLLKQLYQDVYAAREGTMSITPLAAPNALLLIGREESIKKLSSLVAKLDQPVPPMSRFRIFRLKHCPAEQAQKNITDFFGEEAPEGTSLVPRVHVVFDFRSNSLIVRATPRDMDEVAAILARLDSAESDTFKEVRVFKLKNASAEVLAPVLQDALTGQMYGQRSRRGQGMGAVAAAQAQDYEKKSTRLQMVTIGPDGRQMVNSGILTDAQVTADTRTNSVVVTAAAESMTLIAALVRELDSSPTVEAQVKVFTLRNGDATNMVAMLQNIFSAEVTGEEVAVRTGVVPDETSLVGLHFDVDVRTNSIIATGSAGALVVVEALVTRLDGSDPRERRNTVYRLKNFKAEDVAGAVNQYLTNKRQIESSTEGVISESEQIAREVIVVAEAASNSLIVSATPVYYDEIMRLIEDIDQRPAMAVIQVVIAEVSLTNFDEFGVELSLQDSLLFDRRLATGGLAVPGSIFSNGRDTGGQAVTSLGTGQVNTELSYGGLVLSASSESVSALIRALSTCRRLKVLSRPQIMTMDNQAAQVVVGEDVPFITGTSFSEFGQQNSISYREVGLILTVTPRITPDGFVVMEITATNSQVGPIDEGIPVSVADGEVIRSPRIELISAQTVVSAVNGQTVVLGGLIVEDNDLVVRRVPVLSNIPVIGNLFKYQATNNDRRELLIIMTPRIVRSGDDAQRIACVEASRIHWCRSDVERLHGGYAGDPFFGPGASPGPQVIYPDETPTVDMMPQPDDPANRPEVVPVPTPAPVSSAPQPSQSEPRPSGSGGITSSPGTSPANKQDLKIFRPTWQIVPARSTTPPNQPTPAPTPSTDVQQAAYVVQPLPPTNPVRPAAYYQGN